MITIIQDVRLYILCRYKCFGPKPTFGTYGYYPPNQMHCTILRYQYRPANFQFKNRKKSHKFDYVLRRIKYRLRT